MPTSISLKITYASLGGSVPILLFIVAPKPTSQTGSATISTPIGPATTSLPGQMGSKSIIPASRLIRVGVTGGSIDNGISVVGLHWAVLFIQNCGGFIDLRHGERSRKVLE